MRNYDKEFKLNAVKLYKESGRSMNSVADELGIPFTTFHQWVTAYKKEGDTGFPGKGNPKSSEAELNALRKELHHVRQERDILKKQWPFFQYPKGKVRIHDSICRSFSN
ncbi:MAG: transposase [Pseudomonadota bacterium]|jgi:transposase-like protein